MKRLLLGEIWNRLSDLLPPVVDRFSRRTFGRFGFFGHYASFDAAWAASTGYDNAAIVERVLASARQVKRGEAAFERDGVAFQDPAYVWPVLTSLLYAASCSGNRLNVIDFGGSLGSLYFQHRAALKHLAQLKWSVVEQPAFVAHGRREFEDETLRFFESIDDVSADPASTLLLLSGVVHYLPAPYDFLETVVARGFRFLLLDRTPFFADGRERIMVQRVPPTIYDASYPVWILARDRVLRIVEAAYDRLFEFDGIDRMNLDVRFRGFLFARKSGSAQ